MNEQLLTYERKRNAFEKRYTAKVRKALNKQLFEYVESYKQGRADINIFTSFEVANVLFAIYSNVGKHFGRREYYNLRSEAKVRTNGVNKSVELSYQVKRAALGFSIDWANKIIERLRIQGLNLAQKISSTTRRKVLYILQEAQTENLSLDETVKRLIEEVKEFNRNRAETIARTEVGRAATEGKMQGAKELGVELDKIWISAEDYRVRRNPTGDARKGDHWKLNEQRRSFDEPFNNGVHRLNQPGDPNAPASETINCRCTVVFKVKKDAQGRTIRRNYIDKPFIGNEFQLEAVLLEA